MNQLHVAGIAAALLLPSAAACAEGTDGLGRLVRAAGAPGLCYRRAYDRDHLARHPSQTITAVTVLLESEMISTAGAGAFGLLARIERRGGAQAMYGMAACWWEAGSNRTGGGARSSPLIKSNDATRCMSTVAPGSAEEAGELLLADDEDGRGLLVVNGFYQMRTGPSGARVMRDVAFGAADAMLRLERVERARCAALKPALGEPVQVQNR